MPFSGLADFIALLEKNGELNRIRSFVDPVLEIAEVTDRITKSGGKALLFENTGTDFPVLINAFGSDKRMAMAIGRNDLDEATKEIISLFNTLTGTPGNILNSLPPVMKISGFLPSRTSGKGRCQQVINKEPDLSMLPVLKCWPHDGGRFITLPVVHTVHPSTGKTNAGMYRMQILNKNSSAMHWQRHKTGAGHFEAWKKNGKRMPVSVSLGGDPVYTYAATAPLPENIDEYILAGFLRNKKVKLVRCITNDLFVPYDADIVIEGYVDPSEDPVLEGPFGDHTGFYSLADFYPRFHVTCITHSEKAVYPALQPEIEDFHMPAAGIAHNLVIVKINKTYPGQGKKVISSLLGAGQLMFTKYIAVVSGETDIRNYRDLTLHIFKNTRFRSDLLFISGPLDILDHSSDMVSLGGKLGIDGTVKLKEESSGSVVSDEFIEATASEYLRKFPEIIINASLQKGLPVAVVSLSQSTDSLAITKARDLFKGAGAEATPGLILAVDDTVDVDDWFTVAWQILGNTDPQRDLDFISDNSVFIDGTIKAFRKGGFPRRWPNVVCSSEDTVKRIDQKWESLEIGSFIPSPSEKSAKLLREGNDEVTAGKGLSDV
jgi:4-hydroxy-3-polyprenylbenzoate decarboxylase